MASAVEHVNLLCVFPCESDLKAAKDVFQEGTGCTFVLDPRCPHIGTRICHKWKSKADAKEISIAFASQTKRGGTECSSRLSELASHYTADLVVMGGTCTGMENVDSHLQHGSVLVVRKATVTAGIQSSEFKPDAEYAELGSQLASLIDPFISEMTGTEWLNAIPDSLCCPSPRYAREIIMDMLRLYPHGLAKSAMIEKGVALRQKFKVFKAMDNAKWGYIIRTMINDNEPWIELIDDERFILKNTRRAIKYYKGADVFPRRDQIGVSLATMGSMDWQLESLSLEVDELKKRMATQSLVAVDQESYQFMKLCPSALKGSQCLVIKGMSEYCRGVHGQTAFFEMYAACTAAAFLRLLVTKRQEQLFKSLPVVSSECELTIAEFDFSNDQVIDATIRAVQGHAATRAVALGMEMKFSQDRINGLLHHLVEPSDQIRIIFGARSSHIGRERAARELLMACKKVTPTNFHCIISDMRRQLGK